MTNALVELVEKQHLLQWMHRAERSPNQLNDVFEADCELVTLQDGQTLAVTTDAIAEEIALGLYKDPYTCGWTAATASLSDLAAVGATPIGLLLSTCFGSEVNHDFRSSVSRGFSDAATRAGTYVLGGDCSQGGQTVLTSTGVGICKTPLTRISAQEGDVLVLSGQNGLGPALAYNLLLNCGSDLEKYFQPYLEPAIKISFAENARAMIDTSDGILSAVTTLCALNGVGARLTWNEKTLDSRAMQFCNAHEIPLWALWVAEHGDYQLLAVMSKDNAAHVDGHVIGEIAPEGTFDLMIDGMCRTIDPSWGQLVAQTHPSEYKARCRALIDEFRSWGP
jgi:thiamine-monophosphate kinase